MKKLAAKRKKPARKARQKPTSPRGSFLHGMDVDFFRQMLMNVSAGGDDLSLEDMIEPFLSKDLTVIGDLPDPEAMSELSEELDRLRVDVNGGDAEAREELNRAREMIDRAANRNEIHPAALMILGRLFAGAHVDIGDSARALMKRMVAAGLFREPGQEGCREIVQPLLNDLTGDDFGLHEEIRCAIGIFPADYKIRLVESLAVDSDDKAQRGAVGFLLDADDSIALAAIHGFAASSAGGRLGPASRRRIDVIRPWLSASRREALDRAFPPDGARLQADGDNRIVKTTASACDGSGAASLIATIKRGARFDVVVLMTKSSGIADSFIVERLPKAQAAEIESDARDSVLSATTPLETWLRLVQLALGRNVASNSPPPFEFVRAVEALGLDSLVPDVSTSADILDSLLADLGDRDDAAAIVEAHESVIDSDAVDNWFEAGEAVDAVLRSAENFGDGGRILLEQYLPTRRLFWANQCALTALALREASPRNQWRKLALVGRDILGDTPLTDIPLMGQIADTSALAFFANRA
jgi:hypothetical protein